MSVKPPTCALIILCSSLTLYLLSYSVCVNGADLTANEVSYNEIDVHRKVKVTLFYESMCPFSKAFITGQLHPAYLKLADYMDVSVVPFGNGNINWKTLRSNKSYFSITCQHGENECKGNRIQACAVKHYNSTKLWLQLIACMSMFFDPYNQGKKCADGLKVGWKPVSKCANGNEGERLSYQMGTVTKAQIPRVHHVPYVVIGGVYDRNLERKAVKNLFQLVCDLLGKYKPKVCKAE